MAINYPRGGHTPSHQKEKVNWQIIDIHGQMFMHSLMMYVARDSGS